MERNDYYNDLKWCGACGTYVRYLMSMEHSYCVDCGAKVKLFSDADWTTFNDELQAAKAKGGRPSKQREATA